MSVSVEEWTSLLDRLEQEAEQILEEAVSALRARRASGEIIY